VTKKDVRRLVTQGNRGTNTFKMAPVGALIGRDPRIVEIAELVKRVAPTDATVLIVGETGTGKELIARLVHVLSLRRASPFVPVNCGAVPESVLESELFGHTRGSFTGATADAPGKFGAASHGTIFLDEVSAMGNPMQVALLRVLQSGEYSPVGSPHALFCDVRIVAASNADPRRLVDSGALRPDLYYRLNIIRLELPPLRERAVDIPLLAAHFVRLFAERYGKAVPDLDRAAVDALLRYSFPGNVRELQNLIHRAVVLAGGKSIGAADLAIEHPSPRKTTGIGDGAASFHEAKAQAIEQFERTFLSEVLGRSDGVISRAAREAGLSERNFHVKLRRYGIRCKSMRSAVSRS
jgi:two-component system response regulator HydG